MLSKIAEAAPPDSAGTFMFEIIQTDVIRVRVYVPQDAAFGLPPASMRSYACPNCRIAGLSTTHSQKEFDML